MEQKSVKLKSTADLLKKTLLVSTMAFVVAGFLAQIIANAWYALMMRIYSIPFQYALIEIEHCTRSLEYWNEGNILLIYGIGGIFIMSLALYFIHNGMCFLPKNWITGIFVLWLPIHLIGSLVGQAVISIVSPNGIGHAIQWLFPGRFERVLIGIGALVTWFLTTRYWAGRFLFTARSEYLIHDVKDRRDYIATSMALAWFFGTILTAILELPDINIYSSVSNILLGLIAIGGIYQFPLVGYVKIQDASLNLEKARVYYKFVIIFITLVVIIRWFLRLVF